MKTHLDINETTDHKIELHSIDVRFNRAGQIIIYFTTNYKYLHIHWSINESIEKDGVMYDAYGFMLRADDVNGDPLTGATLWLIPENQQERSAIESSCEAVLATKYEYFIALIPTSDLTN